MSINTALYILNFYPCVYRKTRCCSDHQLNAGPFKKFVRNAMDGEKLQPDSRIQIVIPAGEDEQEQPRDSVQTSHEKSKYLYNLNSFI